MARTEQGRVLTEQHRLAQVQLRAQALQDYIRVWPLWNGDDGASFTRMVAAAVPIVVGRHAMSASLAAAYYEIFRRTERVAGSATPRTPPSVDPEQVATSLHVTARVTVRKALIAGRSPQEAMDAALIRSSGAVTRHVLAGGRGALVLSAGEDKQATGWARVTAPSCCSFCAMLSSRGPAYPGRAAAEFQAHDACACMAEPAYENSEWPGRAREFRELWDQSTRGQEDQLNAFRRAFEAA